MLTGAFSLDDFLAVEIHDDDEEFDDDFSWFNPTKYLELHGSPPDGYITKIGTEVIIHIKPEFNTTEIIENIKKDFGIIDNKRITTIKVEEISKDIQ